MMTINELLSLYDNEYAYNELIKQLNNTIPFVGAGLTCSIYPLWRQYLLNMCKKYNIKNTKHLFDNNLYEDIAELILNTIGDVAFYAEIKTTFSSSKYKATPISGAITLLPTIFTNTVITTNFDRSLEMVYEQSKCEFDNVLFPCFSEQITKTFSGNRHNLIKLHGDITENSFLVFTKTQYNDIYGDPIDNNKPFLKMLRRCIEGKTLLFLGCSLNADKITSVLENIIAENKSITHFAILEEPNKKQYAKEIIRLSKMGILPIFYPKKQYEYVNLILNEIQKKNSI